MFDRDKLKKKTDRAQPPFFGDDAFYAGEPAAPDPFSSFPAPVERVDSLVPLQSLPAEGAMPPMPEISEFSDVPAGLSQTQLTGVFAMNLHLFFHIFRESFILFLLIVFVPLIFGFVHPLLLLLATALFSVFICISLGSQIGRTYEILRFGKRTEGVVTRSRVKVFVEEDYVRGLYPYALNWGRRRQRRILYTALQWTFTAEDGRVCTSEVYYPNGRKWMLPEGTRGYVYYDPHDPLRNVWLGTDWRRFVVYLEKPG